MRKATITIAFALAALVACGNQNNNNAPPGCRISNDYLRCEGPYGGSALCCESSGAEPYTCWSAGTPQPTHLCTDDPFDPNNQGATDGSDSGSGGMTSTTTGDEPWCTENCPDDADGVCPGHGEWDRGIMIWPVHRPNNDNGQPDMSGPASVTHQDPVCAPSMGICVSYMHPDDIPSKHGEMTMMQLQECQGLTKGQLAGLGLSDTSIGQYGHTLVDHICVQGTQLNAMYQGQSFGATATASQSSCLGEWKYEGSCGESSCPVSGGDSSSGQADSTAGDSGEAFIDCSPVSTSSGEISVSIPNRWKKNERHVAVRGSAAATLLANPYDALWYCSDAKIDDDGFIYELPKGSLLSNLGLIEDDFVKEVDGEGGTAAAKMDAVANAVNQNRPVVMKIYRGNKLLEYTLEVIPPS